MMCYILWTYCQSVKPLIILLLASNNIFNVTLVHFNIMSFWLLNVMRTWYWRIKNSWLAYMTITHSHQQFPKLTHQLTYNTPNFAKSLIRTWNGYLCNKNKQTFASCRSWRRTSSSSWSPTHTSSTSCPNYIIPLRSLERLQVHYQTSNT